MKTWTTTLLAIAMLGVSGLAADVYVVHGVPSTNVDVYVNGNMLLADFAFTEVAGPVDVPAGEYDIEVFVAGADPATDPPAIALPAVSLTDDQQVSIVAHLTADGGLALTPFGLDTQPVSPFFNRIAVRHTAAAPAVDIRFESTFFFLPGRVTFGAGNTGGAQGFLPNLPYDVSVTLPGDPSAVVTSLPFNPERGASYVIYAVGSVADGTFTFVVQTFDTREF